MALTLEQKPRLSRTHHVRDRSFHTTQKRTTLSLEAIACSICALKIDVDATACSARFSSKQSTGMVAVRIPYGRVAGLQYILISTYTPLRSCDSSDLGVNAGCSRVHSRDADCIMSSTRCSCTSLPIRLGSVVVRCGTNKGVSRMLAEQRARGGLLAACEAPNFVTLDRLLRAKEIPSSCSY